MHEITIDCLPNENVSDLALFIAEALDDGPPPESPEEAMLANEEFDQRQEKIARAILQFAGRAYRFNNPE